MAVDGFLLNAVKVELEERLVSLRVGKIHQPRQELLTITFRGRESSYKLLLSAHPVRCRVHLTERAYPNPLSPPTFCMVLRKHLEGSKLVKISQPALERQLEFSFEARDELGNSREKVLICEIMGKHSNILLVDKETNTIIDAIKRYTHTVSQHREVLPGRPYVPPPEQKKVNPLLLDAEQFQQLLLQCPLHWTVDKGLLNIVQGFSPQTCKEIIVRAGLDTETRIDTCGQYEIAALWLALEGLVSTIRNANFKPTIIRKDARLVAFAPVELKQFHNLEQIHFASTSQALDHYFQSHEEWEAFQTGQHDLKKRLEQEINRFRKKISIQEETLASASQAEQYRIFGELITTNIYRIKQGQKELIAENFYDPQSPRVTIPLDPERSPAANAQVYFKRYNKAKKSARQAAVHLAKNREDLDYLESVLQSVTQAQNIEDLQQLTQELEKTGYIRKSKPHQENTKENTYQSRPFSFNSFNGYLIYVGKNNTQNDFLTLKVAKPDDLWLHVKDLPGSHVVICKKDKKEIPLPDLKEAALLAAYFSKGKESSNVPVDYTLVKHVRKPKGARPGMVVYEHHNTLYVTPSPEALAPILKRKIKD